MKIIRAILFWFLVGIGGFLTLWIFGMAGYAVYMTHRADNIFAEEHASALFSTWDRKAIEGHLDTSYGTGWSKNIRIDMEEMLKRKSSSTELDALLAQASKTLGTYNGKAYGVCVGMDVDHRYKDSKDRFCMVAAPFASGNARLIMVLRPNPEEDKAHAYKITGVYIEYPYMGKIVQ